jgi:predicted phage terminase large subunit-like protein
MLIPTPELFTHPSHIHGQRHVARVMIHAFRLIDATGWTHLATRLWGAVYPHDLARTHDGRCLRHGADAVERWRTSSQLSGALAAHNSLHYADEPGVQRAVTQQPIPAGGTIFQRGWFRYYDELPRGLSQAQSWDMAFKDKADNDFVVGLVGGRAGEDIYLIDRVKEQWSFSESCRQVEGLRQRYPQAHTILIEDAANGPAIIDALHHKVPGIIAVRPEGGKQSRAQAAQPRVEAGNVYLPNPRPQGRLIPERAWVDDFLDQLTALPFGAHDDDVDAFTQLLVRWQRPQVSCVW